MAAHWLCRRRDAYLSFPRAAPRTRHGRKVDHGAILAALANECRKVDIKARGPRLAPRLHVDPIARRRAAIRAPAEKPMAVAVKLCERIEDDRLHAPHSAGDRSGSE